MGSSYINPPTDISYVVTISANSSADIYVPSNVRAILYMFSITSTAIGMYMITSNTSSGNPAGLVKVTDVVNASSLTLTPQQNNLHIESAASTNVVVYCTYLYSSTDFDPPRAQVLTP